MFLSFSAWIGEQQIDQNVDIVVFSSRQEDWAQMFPPAQFVDRQLPP